MNVTDSQHLPPALQGILHTGVSTHRAGKAGCGTRSLVYDAICHKGRESGGVGAKKYRGPPFKP